MASSYLSDSSLVDYYNSDPNLGYTMDYVNQYASYNYQGYLEESFGTWDSSLESPSSLSVSDQENDPFKSLDCAIQQDIHSDYTNDSEIVSKNYDQCDNENSEDTPQAPKSKNSKLGVRNAPLRKVHQRHAANIRERKRMKTINDAFEHLRVCVPTACDDRKMSKVDTLKMAIRYIGDLTDVLKSCGDGVLPGMRTKTNNHVVIKYNYLNEELPSDFAHMEPLSRLYGHSLSWVDTRECAPVVDNKLRAKLWIPHLPSQEDLAAITTHDNS